MESPTVLEMPKTLPVKRFTEVFGVTARAIEGKINRKTWVTGAEYIKDPDGKIHIIIEGYYKWLSKHQPKQLALGSESNRGPSSSTLGGKINDTAPSPSLSQHKRVSKLQPVFDAKL